jgi:phosphoribosylformylglycinamidine synthase subunit PurQ / glutaminase
MKAGVIIFPGSNCDHDSLYVMSEIYGLETFELWHKEKDLKGCDFIIVPGGFSYGDYLRSGAIARFAPIMEKVIEFANNGGYVLGICNGFQILTEAHLLPGALLRNIDQKFICKNVYIKAQTQNTAVTHLIPSDKALKIPIAHAEGRFYADQHTIDELVKNDQIIFRYCDAEGNITPESNPNGSLDNIAGITNKGRNVFGLMPHPERASDSVLGNTDGRFMFNSIIASLVDV